jgi:hypothetical protein
MQVDIAKLHVDVMKTKWTTDWTMAKNVKNVFFATSAFIFGSLEFFDSSQFVFDILTSERSKESDYFPCKLLERQLDQDNGHASVNDTVLTFNPSWRGVQR